ncbi:MAG: metallophosphoesterase family protein [Candidatus Omnitrophota bacterium]
MRWGIFSDIHSNLEALEATIKAYKFYMIDKYLCLGDIVGYAASPLECIKIVKDISHVVIAGNHDWAAVDLFPTKYFNEWAKTAVEWTKDKLDLDARDLLSSLGIIYEDDDLIAVHGTLDSPEKFNYLFSVNQSDDTFWLMKKPVCFIGHTHLSGIFIQDPGGKSSYCIDKKIKLKQGYRYIVNVGSIGQPRDGNNQAGFCVYDTNKQEVELIRASYDIQSAQRKIITACLPSFLSDRLSTGG